jgi:GT2 family glycosyltransferase
MFDPSRVIPEGKLSGYYAIGDRYLPYVTTTMAIAREAFERVGPFHEGIPILSDTDMVVRLLDAGVEAGVLPEALAVRRLHDAQVTKDHSKAFEESAVVLKNVQVSDEMRESLRRDLALEIGTYLLKNLEPEKMQAFLRRSAIEHDAAYAILYAKGYLPRHVLALLYKARKLYLELRYQPRFAGKEFRAIDALVGPIL